MTHELLLDEDDLEKIILYLNINLEAISEPSRFDSHQITNLGCDCRGMLRKHMDHERVIKAMNCLGQLVHFTHLTISEIETRWSVESSEFRSLFLALTPIVLSVVLGSDSDINDSMTNIKNIIKAICTSGIEITRETDSLDEPVIVKSIFSYEDIMSILEVTNDNDHHNNSPKNFKIEKFLAWSQQIIGNDNYYFNGTLQAYKLIFSSGMPLNAIESILDEATRLPDPHPLSRLEWIDTLVRQYNDLWEGWCKKIIRSDDYYFNRTLKAYNFLFSSGMPLNTIESRLEEATRLPEPHPQRRLEWIETLIGRYNNLWREDAFFYDQQSHLKDANKQKFLTWSQKIIGNDNRYFDRSLEAYKSLFSSGMPLNTIESILEQSTELPDNQSGLVLIETLVRRYNDSWKEWCQKIIGNENRYFNHALEAYNSLFSSGITLNTIESILDESTELPGNQSGLVWIETLVRRYPFLEEDEFFSAPQDDLKDFNKQKFLTWCQKIISGDDGYFDRTLEAYKSLFSSGMPLNTIESILEQSTELPDNQSGLVLIETLVRRYPFLEEDEFFSAPQGDLKDFKKQKFLTWCQRIIRGNDHFFYRALEAYKSLFNSDMSSNAIESILDESTNLLHSNPESRLERVETLIGFYHEYCDHDLSISDIEGSITSNKSIDEIHSQLDMKYVRMRFFKTPPERRSTSSSSQTFIYHRRLSIITEATHSADNAVFSK